MALSLCTVSPKWLPGGMAEQSLKGPVTLDSGETEAFLEEKGKLSESLGHQLISCLLSLMNQPLGTMRLMVGSRNAGILILFC